VLGSSSSRSRSRSESGGQLLNTSPLLLLLLPELLLPQALGPRSGPEPALRVVAAVVRRLNLLLRSGRERRQRGAREGEGRSRSSRDWCRGGIPRRQ